MHQEEIKKKVEAIRAYLDELKPLLAPVGAVIIQDKVKVSNGLRQGGALTLGSDYQKQNK